MSMLSVTRTRETIEKIRASNIGKKRTLEVRLQLSKLKKGKKLKPLSDETKKKISEGNKGKTLSEEAKEKLRQANLGKKISDEVKKKISDSHKGKILSDDTKQKMKEYQSNRPKEHNEKISKTMLSKKYKRSPEAKQKMREAKLGKGWSQARREAFNKNDKNNKGTNSEFST